MNLFQALQKLVQSVFKPTPAPKPAELPSTPKPSVAPKPVSPAIKAPQPDFSPASVSGASAQVKLPTSAPTPSKPSSPVTAQPSQQQRQSQPQQQTSQQPQPVPTPQATIMPSSLGATSTPPTLSSTGASANVTGLTSALPGQNAAAGNVKGITPDLGQATQVPSAQIKDPLIPTNVLGNVGKGLAAASQFGAENIAPFMMGGGGLSTLEGVGPAAEQLGSRLLPKIITGALGLGGLGAATTATAPQAHATLDTSKLNTSGALTTPQGQPTTMATPENLGPSITDKTLMTHAITSVLQNPSKAQGVISQIASPQAQAEVIKMQDQAQKVGDMNAVRTLANLHDGITKQLQLIDQIGRAVLAQAKGFGTPNAPGVTETRMPMVQQAVGQQLTSPQIPQPNFSQSPVSGQSAQMMSPRLPTASVQQNRPPQFPFMGR